MDYCASGATTCNDSAYADSPIDAAPQRLILAPEHFAQLRNYLGLLGMRVGLLVNFHGHPNVEIRRIFLNGKNDAGVVEDIATGETTPIKLHS